MAGIVQRASERVQVPRLSSASGAAASCWRPVGLPDRSGAMKTCAALLLSCLVAIGLSGCLQDEKVVKVNADGSGTLEETFLLGKQAVAQIKQMTEGFGALAKGLNKGANGDASGGFKVLDEDKLREAAGKLGDGVKFVSARPLSTEEGEGYAVIYAFRDINKLKLD